ncbi:hypothetical protein H2198_003903 [Neophaeococcomyces mojaviensis]|uniref:Uncharacterized protein n=1 Tax=Neophaeococcomyces mojaviensis TaxID=3383035 RepID=A0ACC3A9Y6_9EURO|nr:hypothetical protein H2198_003903 [Knufia sp. JES_112]
MTSNNQGDQAVLPPTPNNPNPVDFGPNVIIFDPSMDVGSIQSRVNDILTQQKPNQFGEARYAFFFKPGSYNNLNVEIGYYTTVHGLGHSPDEVTITGGGVQSGGIPPNGLALNNFWRGVENLAVHPTNDGQPQTPKNLNINLWAVSQATYMRRVHVKGVLFLSDFHYDGTGGNYSSGGFLADSLVDTSVISRTQQQWMSRNTNVAEWPEGVWNMVFVGCENTPSGPWPQRPYTVVNTTPLIREKPYLVIDKDGKYSVRVPHLRRDSKGPSWSGSNEAVTSLPINQFYIAHSNRDNADTLNAALQQGHHLILTPGIYRLDKTLHVRHPNKVILGLGMATLTPTTGTPIMKVADVPGISLSGIIFDAGPTNSPILLEVGQPGSSADHSTNPIALFDIVGRVGGPSVASATVCLTINSHHVLLDNVWLWRADHAEKSEYVGWDTNPCQNGLIVNGNDMTAYGLFVEHFLQYQTIWNGERGSTYMYQSEIPYDVPSQDRWMQNGEKGYPSYKISNNVTTHTGRGMGIYCNFLKDGVQLDNAIETPNASGIDLQHLITVWLDGKPWTGINHIVNGRGGAVLNRQPMTATL